MTSDDKVNKGCDEELLTCSMNYLKRYKNVSLIIISNTGTMTEALQIAKFNCDRVSHMLLQTLSKSHSVNIPTSTVEQLSK